VRLVVLVSGSGTNLQALLDASADPAYGAEVVAVGADRDGIEGLARAERAGLPTFVLRVADFDDRAAWDQALTKAVAEHQPDTHPALSPSVPGMHGAAEALAYGVKVTGCTLFLVDEGVDTGPIVAQRAVEVAGDDTAETLHERIKVAERAMLVETIGAMARDGFSVHGRRVVVGG
jgi:phosphoribosylglycinamide formyltransferase 1